MRSKSGPSSTVGVQKAGVVCAYSHNMSYQLIGLICAIVALILTPFYLKIGFSGVKTLKEMRDKAHQ